MSLHYYHPNKAVKGFACSFWFSDRDGSVYATLIKQSGWDDVAQNGIFKDSKNDPEKKVNVKLSWIEIGGILNCIEKNRPFKQYHDSEAGNPKQLTFTPMIGKEWIDGEGVKHPPTQTGYSFTITVTKKEDKEYKNAFYIALTFDEGRYLREYLIYLMHASFENRTFSRPARQEVDSQLETSNISEKPESKDELTGF